MEKPINIIEILKDAPEGTPLYSPICGKVILDSVNDDYIYTYTADRKATVTFFSDGKYLPCPDAECMLFPSKDNRDWDTFNVRQNFKKGDIVARVYDVGYATVLLMGETDWRSPNNTVRYICYVDLYGGDFHVSKSTDCWCTVKDFYDDDRYRLATDDEKKKLLDAIDKHGYVWDDENLELREKECPNFKKGDFVADIHDDGNAAILLMGDTDWSSPNNEVKYICYVDLSDDVFDVAKSTDYWCTINYFSEGSKSRLATDDEKKKLFDAIDKHGYVWDEVKLELKKKEHVFKPFDKVLVRDHDDTDWRPGLFGFRSEYGYCVDCVYWLQCIPYEGNEHLLGTTDSPVEEGYKE